MSVRLRYLYRAYRYRLHVDPAELRFVCSQLHAGQVAVDVGCHKGAYTYWMRRRVGSGGAVFAFEPQPKQVSYLRSAFTAMNYDNVVIVPMAASDTCGKLPLHLPQGAGKTHAASLVNPSGHCTRGSANTSAKSMSAPSLLMPTESMLVEVTTLDSFFASQDRGPNLIKIDVEGHESAVLAGAQQTLKVHRPAILIECEARHRSDHDVHPVFDYLHALGYRGSFFLNGQRRPLTEFDPLVHQHITSETTAVPRDYVNNFAFIPSEM